MMFLQNVAPLSGVVGPLSPDVASFPADLGEERRDLSTYFRRSSFISIICACWDSCSACCDSYSTNNLSTA
jgi:hypothetical protein